MASQEEIKIVRLEKIEKLKSFGMEIYPAKSFRTHTILEVLKSFEIFEQEKREVTLAGRVMAIRGQGAIVFLNIFDGTGTLQILFKKGERISDELLGLFQEAVDIGDFIEITGTLFVTKRGEKTLQGSSWRMLTKSLRALPEKWHGLENIDERLRNRYLDFIMKPEERELIILKSKFWQAIRNFLLKRDFLEVETPMLEVTTGGAEARPFITHHNDFDIDLFLRISVGELWQKRLMAGGFSKTFEIGRVFRNEGGSINHAQEYTNFEFYASYTDYQEGMRIVKDLYTTVAKEVFGKTNFESRGYAFDFEGEWPVIDYVSEIERQTGLNILEASEKELVVSLEELKVKYEAKTRERLVDALWKHCRKAIAGPSFVIGYPDFMQALAKRNSNNKNIVEQFQVIIGGSEIGKGYSELNDPLDQKARFDHQQELQKKGDDEAMMADYDFVEMLEYGMPPTFGFGAGERLFSFLVDKPIREVTAFPLMKPRV